MATQSPSRPIAVLKLPEYEVPRLIIQARRIVQSMTGNPSFPAPTPSLATVQAAIDDLASAETATLTRMVGAVANRNAKRIALVMRLQHLLSHIQTTADANVENAVSIIESAGVSVKKTGVLPARVFAATPGAVSGSVNLVAPGAGNRSGYDWGYSTDGGKTWTSAPFTMQANTTVPKLAPGSTAQFRYRAFTKDGGGDWSQTVAIIVQ